MICNDGKIDARQMLSLFMQHVLGCPSAHIVLDSRAAFESWFQVELAHLLCYHSNAAVQTQNTYPGTTSKADLSVTTDKGCVVFELKCLVGKQDSNKMERFPQQLRALRNVVETGQAVQGVALVTFIGYSESVIRQRFDKFFPQTEWGFRHIAPFPGHGLWIGTAST